MTTKMTERELLLTELHEFSTLAEQSRRQQDWSQYSALLLHLYQLSRRLDLMEVQTLQEEGGVIR